MRKVKDKLIASITIFAGVYYLLSELITIYQTKDGLTSYKDRSISNLGINTTPFHTLMNSALIINGFFYALGIAYICNKRYNKFTAVLAVIVGIASIGVGLFPEDSILFLHYISTALVFATGNVLGITLGIYEKNKGLKIAFITTGIIGLVSAFLIFFIKPLLPIFERLTVYSIVIIQITLGIIYLLDTYKCKELATQ